MLKFSMKKKESPELDPSSGKQKKSKNKEAIKRTTDTMAH